MRIVKYILFFSTIIVTCMLTTVPSQASSEQNQSVGLVLSGGGAKGIAHIGAIKALEDNDIPIDYITGTSMGAIVGSLYAIGYSPEEMMALICSPYFGYMAQGKIDPEFTYRFSSPAPSPQLFSFQLGPQSQQQKNLFNPQSLISPEPMMFGFMEIYGASTAQCQGNFDRLFVPFRCVSSDMTKLKAHVFSSGDLAQAVRASMSFPLVFQSIKIDGDMYYDGGIFDNFPVDVMHRDFNPDVMVGFDVSASSTGPPNSYMDQLDLLVMRPQTYDLPEEYGVKIRIDLNRFSLLDFGAALQIYQIGYQRTIEAMDSIKARVHTRMPKEKREQRRARYRSATPELRFANVDVSGATRRQNDYIRHLFGRPGDTISMDKARLAYYRALASDKLNTLIPSAAPADSSGLFNLSLRASVKRNYDLGIGAYVTSTNNSFLYARLGYSNLSFSSLNTNFEAWIGQSYMAGVLSGALYLNSATPSALRLEAVASRRRYHENEKLFFRDNEPTFVIDHQYYGRLGFSLAAGRTGAVDVGLAAGRIYNSFYRNNNPASYLSGRDNIGLNLAQIFGQYEATTADNLVYPTKGYDRFGYVAAVTGRSHYYNAVSGGARSSSSQHWAQISWRERDYFDIARHFSIGVEAQVTASTRKLLPSYYASVTTAPYFAPTPAANNVFDPAMRANSFAALSLVPVYKYNSSLSTRLSASVFVPARAIVEQSDGTARYGKWFGKTHFFGELDIVYNLSFATVSAYCNYSNTRHHFNAGISLGTYITAPRFLK